MRNDRFNEKGFISNPLAISRAGGKELLSKYHKLASRDGSLGCYHQFNRRDSSQPQGRLLFVYSTIEGFYVTNQDGNGRFVGVKGKPNK